MRLFLHPLHAYEWISYFNPIGRLAAWGGQECRSSRHEATPEVVYHPGYGVVCAHCRVSKLGPFYKTWTPAHHLYNVWL